LLTQSAVSIIVVSQCDYPPLPSDQYSDNLRKVVAECINPEPDKRPDIKYVHQIAVEMHLKTQHPASAGSTISYDPAMADSFKNIKLGERQ